MARFFTVRQPSEPRRIFKLKSSLPTNQAVSSKIWLGNLKFAFESDLEFRFGDDGIFNKDSLSQILY